jgi:hypothetical protein
MNERLRGWFKSPGIRLAAYFIATAIVVMTLTWAFPWLRNLVLTPALTPTDGIPGLDGAVLQDGPAGTFSQQVTQTAFIALLTLLGALVFTAPMVWIYTVIHRQQGYDRSFVRMLVTLPVVVAGVVQVVGGNLALAFALAGIVAAVRFRTTVKDLEDAVFAFGVIGIGLASGTGSLTMAYVPSSRRRRPFAAPRARTVDAASRPYRRTRPWPIPRIASRPARTMAPAGWSRGR